MLHHVVPVRGMVVGRDRGIWEPGHYEYFNHDQLTAVIVDAGARLDRTYTLSTMTYADRRVGLGNGIHRWQLLTSWISSEY